jgi:hypothetical protein
MFDPSRHGSATTSFHNGGMKLGAAFFATVLSALLAILAVGAMVEVGADVLVAVITTITPP